MPSLSEKDLHLKEFPTSQCGAFSPQLASFLLLREAIKNYLFLSVDLQHQTDQGVLAMTTATAGTKPCNKSISILPSNVAAV